MKNLAEIIMVSPPKLCTRQKCGKTNLWLSIQYQYCYQYLQYLPNIHSY